MFRVLGPRIWSTGSGIRRMRLQRVQQFLDRGFAQFRIGGMGHAPGGDDFATQRAFGSERELVLGGLAIDQVAGAAAVPGGLESSRAVALLADHEQQPDVADAFLERLAHGEDHGRDDAFGVAGSAAPDARVVLARREERRYGIEMRGERDGGGAPVREHVEAAGRDGHLLHRAAGFRGERGEVVVQIHAGFEFVARDGLDIH